MLERAGAGPRNGFYFLRQGIATEQETKHQILFIFVERYDQNVVVIFKMEKTMHCKDENEDFVVIYQNVIRHEGSSS